MKLIHFTTRGIQTTQTGRSCLHDFCVLILFFWKGNLLSFINKKHPSPPHNKRSDARTFCISLARPSTRLFVVVERELGLHAFTQQKRGTGERKMKNRGCFFSLL